MAGANNRARFAYWVGLHQLLRAQAKAWWLWGQFDESFAKGAGAVNATMALRVKLVAQATDVMTKLLATVSSTGSLGTLSDFSQRGLPYMFDQYDARLIQILGGKPLPPAASHHF